MDQIGKRIKAVRIRKKLSQNDIEERTGIKREYLSKLETGALNNPTLITLLKLAEGLDVRIGELVDV